MSSVVPDAPVNPANPGETLRQAREAKNLSQDSVAQSLNLTRANLNYLEEGAFERLPGLTFARGYVRAYARLLELDQNRLVVEFDQFTGTTAGAANVQSLNRMREPVRTSRSVMRFLTLVVFLLLAVGTFLWWQESQRPVVDVGGLSLDEVEVDSVDGTTEVHRFDAEPVATDESVAVTSDESVAQTEAASEAATSAEAPQLVDGQQASAASAESPEQSALSSSAPEQVAPESAVTADPVAADIAASEPTTVTPAAPLGEPVSAVADAAETPLQAGEGRVSIGFSADCWTQVADASGKVLISTLKRKGDTLSVVGKAPLSLILGDASAASVSFNGNAVDLSGYSRGNVARLKVGE